MTEETKRDILRDYNDPANTVKDISEVYGISRAAVAKIAVEMGATPRRKKAYGKRNGVKNKICPKCKKVVEVKGARFCYHCGADVRSGNEILIERNEQLLNNILELPANMRDEFRDVLLANIEALKE